MNLIVQCDGGLCNRINNLINGIYLSKFLGRKLYVWWDLNNACHCPLDKLFSNDFNTNYKEVYNDEFVYYSPFNKKRELSKNKYGELKYRIPWKFHDYVKMHIRPDNDIHPEAGVIISQLKSIQSPTLIFSSSLILTEIITEESILKILGALKPINELSEKIDQIIRENSIDLTVIGIHLRKTDYNLLGDYEVKKSINKYLKENNRSRFLICSDSHETEIDFKKTYPDNIILISEKSFLEKIDKEKTDKEFSNLMRTAESVQSALVDMYVLANTSFRIFSPISTFAQMAFRLSKINIK